MKTWEEELEDLTRTPAETAGVTQQAEENRRRAAREAVQIGLATAYETLTKIQILAKTKAQGVFGQPGADTEIHLGATVLAVKRAANGEELQIMVTGEDPHRVVYNPNLATLVLIEDMATPIDLGNFLGRLAVNVLKS